MADFGKSATVNTSTVTRNDSRASAAGRPTVHHEVFQSSQPGQFIQYSNATPPSKLKIFAKF
jgi:hypothetical protein